MRMKTKISVCECKVWVCVLSSLNTWEVDSSVNRCTRGHRGVDQVRILQPEPSSERAWVRPTKRHPLPVSESSDICHHRPEVCQVSQRLTTTEETQAVCADVTK